VTTHVYTPTRPHPSRAPFPAASHSRLRVLSFSVSSSPSVFLYSSFLLSPSSSLREAMSVSLVLALTLVACIRRRRISDIGEERHSQSGRTRRRSMGEGGCEKGGGRLFAAAGSGGEEERAQRRAAGETRASAKQSL